VIHTDAALRHQTRRLRVLLSLTAVLLTLLARGAWAQEAGKVVEADGRVELGRGGVWTPATVGTGVEMGDELRTGRPGRARLVFQDDSVLALSDDSHLVIDEQLFDPSQGLFRSAIRVLGGKVRALVSDYYREPRAAYQIETPTAVSGVRGTEFVVVYEPRTAVTEIVGVSGRVEVHSVLDRAGREVFITAHEVTAVARGQYPTAPRRLDDTLFRQYLGGLEFIGAGHSESLTVNQPLLTGAAVPEADRLTAMPASPPVQPAAPLAAAAPQTTSAALQQVPDVSRLIGQSPPVVIKEITNGKLGIRF
jgi:hypothetical protein